MKVSILALFAAPALVLGSLAPQSGPAAVAHHHYNIARGIKAHPASHYHGKRGPAKARRCAAKTASLSSASVSSTSVLAHQTTTTTTEKPEEKTTTTTKHRTTTTTAKPKPTADKNDDDDDNSGSGGGQTYTGDATFYSTGLNACGTVDNDSDYIAAADHQLFDSYPGANGNSNQNPICYKKVEACWQGKCVIVSITDRCGGCKWGALDFSPAAFQQLADPDLGRVHGMTWNFV